MCYLPCQRPKGAGLLCNEENEVQAISRSVPASGTICMTMRTFGERSQKESMRTPLGWRPYAVAPFARVERLVMAAAAPASKAYYSLAAAVT